MLHYVVADETGSPRELLTESGLHYNHHRYYDPQTAQYLSPDPLGLAGGLNPYGYVHNPLSYIDPLGLSKCFLTGNTIKKGNGKELITIPETAKVRKLTPPEEYSGIYGYEYKWPNTGDSTTIVRIHGPDVLAPSGSNASDGWIVRIMDGKKVWILMVFIIRQGYLIQIAQVIIHS